MFDPVTILAAFAPVVVKAGEALVQRFIAPNSVKPTSVADLVTLQNLDLERFRILQEADKGGDTYKWVEAVRKLQRPVVVFVTLSAFVYNPNEPVTAALFSTVMFYLFGERVMMYAGKK